MTGFYVLGDPQEWMVCVDAEHMPLSQYFIHVPIVAYVPEPLTHENAARAKDQAIYDYHRRIQS